MDQFWVIILNSGGGQYFYSWNSIKINYRKFSLSLALPSSMSQLMRDFEVAGNTLFLSLWTFDTVPNPHIAFKSKKHNKTLHFLH